MGGLQQPGLSCTMIMPIQELRGLTAKLQNLIPHRHRPTPTHMIHMRRRLISRWKTPTNLRQKAKKKHRGCTRKVSSDRERRCTRKLSSARWKSANKCRLHTTSAIKTNLLEINS